MSRLTRRLAFNRSGPDAQPPVPEGEILRAAQNDRRSSGRTPAGWSVVVDAIEEVGLDAIGAAWIFLHELELVRVVGGEEVQEVDIPVREDKDVVRLLLVKVLSQAAAVVVVEGIRIDEANEVDDLVVTEVADGANVVRRQRLVRFDDRVEVARHDFEITQGLQRGLGVD